jgi:MarR family transcriptional regulator, organic hydroperoxide resistance regulator
MRKIDLQNFLPYLMNRAGLRIGAMFSQDIEHLGVTLPMWRVMLELWNQGDHRLGELAKRTSIDLSTLSRLLVNMQKKNLIVRRRSGLDGRALSLTLTPRGLALAERIAPRAVHFEDVAIAGLSQRDITKLKGLLKKVHDNLERADSQAAPHALGRTRRPPARPKAKRKTGVKASA